MLAGELHLDFGTFLHNEFRKTILGVRITPVVGVAETRPRESVFAVSGRISLVEPVLEPHGVFACVFFKSVREGGIHHVGVDFREECRAEHVGHSYTEYGKVPVVGVGRLA